MCEFCGNDKDIIFPFQLSKCQRCEGEPSLLVAGLGSYRAPSPSRRPSIPLTWRDWKISKPRRLAKALSKDRREGEGGEEDLELKLKQEENSAKQKESRDTTEEEISQAFSLGKLVKAFSRHKDSEEEEEITGGEECDRGREERRNSQSGEVCSKERANSKEREDGHARREKLNLLKVLHIDRLKKSVSKRDSDSETCSSMESLDEAGTGKASKGRWKMSGFASLAKSFSKRDSEDEQKREVKEEEIDAESERRLLGKGGGTVEEGNAEIEVQEDDEMPDEGKKGAAEKTESGAENVEKCEVKKRHQGSAVRSRKRSRLDEDSGGGSDGKRELDTEEEGQKPAVETQSNWRARRTRKARRDTRGRQKREGAERATKKEGGERAESDDVIDCPVESD